MASCLLAEGVDHCQGDGALGGWSGEGRADPGVEYDEARVGAGLEEKSNVSRGGVQGGHADDEADESGADWSDDVVELGRVSKLTSNT